MNRTDRLLAIVLELQRRGRLRAEDLAATFETSKRTIYRDIQALSEAGVPIAAAPGQGYRLMEGYFLPPLSFSRDEAILLLLGAGFVGQTFDTRYGRAAEMAARKIEAVLPTGLRAEVADLGERLRFVASGAPRDVAARENLQTLRRAVLERRTVRMWYHTRFPRPGAPAANWREADPYGLVHVSGSWNLVAHCHLRGDTRHFRLERIEAIELTGRTFERPTGFRLEQVEAGRARALVVRARFEPEAARWVREAPSFYVVEQAETAEGLFVTLRVRDEREVMAWLLSWGARVEVLAPESLRRLLAAEAASILHQYREAAPLLP
jgi:predicted DNA-binding transcriptional regulator YafY